MLETNEISQKQKCGNGGPAGSFSLLLCLYYWVSSWCLSVRMAFDYINLVFTLKILFTRTKVLPPNPLQFSLQNKQTQKHNVWRLHATMWRNYLSNDECLLPLPASYEVIPRWLRPPWQLKQWRMECGYIILSKCSRMKSSSLDWRFQFQPWRHKDLRGLTTNSICKNFRVCC